MNLEGIRLLYDYNAWANHRVQETCAALTAEQFTRNLGSSFPSVRDTLVHILGAEWIWLERWNGRSPAALPPAGGFGDLAGVRARWAEVQRDIAGFVSRLSEGDLAAVREYRTTEGKSYAQPLWQMMQHLVNHGTYHRGQVAAMLRQLGAAPVSTDLIVFYRERASRTRP